MSSIGAAALNVSVVVPWRPSDDYRERAWSFVANRLASYGWEVLQGVHDSADWCKAEAIRDGLQRATGDVLCIHDADVVCDGDSPLQRAVEAIQQGAPWVVPHRLVHRLTLGGTKHVYRHGEFVGPYEETHRGVLGGGIVVLPRDTYEQVPMDARYRGWGSEDASFGKALEVLAGPPLRFTNNLWHLWHPPQERLNRKDSANPASWDLQFQYNQAYETWRKNPERGRAMMQALIDRAKGLDVAA